MAAVVTQIRLNLVPALPQVELGLGIALWIRFGLRGLAAFAAGSLSILLWHGPENLVIAQIPAALALIMSLILLGFMDRRDSLLRHLRDADEPSLIDTRTSRDFQIHELGRLFGWLALGSLLGAAAALYLLGAGVTGTVVWVLLDQWRILFVSTALLLPVAIWFLNPGLSSVLRASAVAVVAVLVPISAALAELPGTPEPAGPVLLIALLSLGVVLWMPADRPLWISLGFGLPPAVMLPLLPTVAGAYWLLTLPVLASGLLYWFKVASIDRLATMYSGAESNQLLVDRLMRFLPVGVVRTDLDGRIRYANPLFNRLMGVEADQLKTLAELRQRIDTPHRSQLDEAWTRFQAGKGDFNQNLSMQINDQQRWLNIRAEVEYEASQPTGYIASVTDITTEKQLELARDRSEAQSRAVLDGAVDAIVTINTRGRILTFNQAAQNMFGFRADEVIGRNVSCLMPEPYRSEHDHYLAHYLRTGERKIIGIGRELVAQRKDGSVLPIYLAVSEVELEGTLTFTGILRDIRQEKAAQEEIRRQNEQLQVTLRNAPLGMVTYRPGQPLIGTNRAFELMLDYDADTLGQCTFEELVHPEDLPALQRQLARVLDDQLLQFAQDLRLRRRDGSFVQTTGHQAITHDEFGRPDRVIAQIEDRTTEMQAEEAAREQQEKLTHVARLSTLGEMTAGIAHEINQPLTAIALYAQSSVRMLDSGKADPEKLRSALEKLNIQSIRAGEVIDRIQRLVQNRDSERELASANQLVRDILRLAESDARVNDIQIDLRLADDLQLVEVDPVQLQQVLLNLVRNGIDAMREVDCTNGNVLRIETFALGTSWIEIRVIDSGTGVAEDFKSRMFTPFSTTKADGMGMGLSICRSIINHHGGMLGFRNNPKAGATFYIQLPVAEAQDHDEQS